MHIQRLKIQNVRSIRSLEIKLTGNCAGWHVVLGDNGSGKSSIIRALALAFIGPAGAAATRQHWPDWIRGGASVGTIEVEVSHEAKFDRWVRTGRKSKNPVTLKVEFQPKGNAQKGRASLPNMSGNFPERSIWGGGAGWFSASFGPFRRFTGGDMEYEKLFYTNPSLAPHLSAFGENVALGEALRWLQDLRFKEYENDKAAQRLLPALIEFLSGSHLLPQGAFIEKISSETVVIRDGAGVPVPVEQLSDGFRSVLSMTFELLRGMVVAYGDDTFIDALDTQTGAINLPGVVAIDEIDAHLHPAWQQRIGDWFVERFPMVQFFVTTHSPIICRSAARGSIWRLPTPGQEETAHQIEGMDRDRLIHGSILDALDTEYFGANVTRSDASQTMMTELARLNLRRSRETLSDDDEKRRRELQGALPSVSAISE